MTIVVEIIILALLLTANGLFALTEMAVVSSRKSRLKAMAATGDARAARALTLAESPDRFLPTVQIGITVVGLLAGAFSGITLAEEIAVYVSAIPWLKGYAEVIGVAVVVVALTYFSLVIGELVPKKLALTDPEGFARRMALPISILSTFARPVVKLLSISTNLILRMLPVRKAEAETVSEAEIRFLLKEGARAGAFHRAEPRMVESVLSFDQLPVEEILTPREKITFLNESDPHEAVWHKVVVSGHSNFPLYRESRDNVVGMVSVKAIYANLAAGIPINLANLATPPFEIQESQTVQQTLEGFKKAGSHVALVRNGTGRLVGLVTLVDILEAIVGEIPSREDRLKPSVIRRSDGTWLVDGTYDLAKLAQVLEVDENALSGPDCVTLADFIRQNVEGAPQEGHSFRKAGLVFEIIDMDRHRVDKILISRENQSFDL